MEVTNTLKRIPLHQLHVALGGKIVPFAGFEMPVRYTSDIEEHNTVRNAVGVFDVSHMGEFFLEGPDALALIQKICTNDASKLVAGKAQYSCFTNNNGGIVDDLLVYKLSDQKYMLVVNASNIDKDKEWIHSQIKEENVKFEDKSSEFCLFAIQGPRAINTLQKLTQVNLSEIPYYSFVVGEIGGAHNIIISATGYTGAGGFELYIPNKDAEAVWNEIFKAGEEFGIKPVGLGARDTLRLEMGFTLYGNDIDDTTSPLEAGLGWITKFNKSFVGDDKVKLIKENGPNKKLVGFEMLERGIPRSHYEILDNTGQKIGEVTSGTQSPCLQKGIGMGYVLADHSSIGNELYISIRNKPHKAKIVKLPFIKK